MQCYTAPIAFPSLKQILPTLIMAVVVAFSPGADLGGGRGGQGPPPHGHTHSIMHAHTYWHSMQVSCYTNCCTDSPAECSVNLASLSV